MLNSVSSKKSEDQPRECPSSERTAKLASLFDPDPRIADRTSTPFDEIGLSRFRPKADRDLRRSLAPILLRIFSRHGDLSLRNDRARARRNVERARPQPQYVVWLPGRAIDTEDSRAVFSMSSQPTWNKAELACCSGATDCSDQIDGEQWEPPRGPLSKHLRYSSRSRAMSLST